jgi:FkbM family methyltransferase
MLKTRQKILLARIAQWPIKALRRCLGLGSLMVVRRRGVFWRLDLDEGIEFAIFLFGAFEPEMVRRYRTLVKQGDTVLDVGANIGAHALHLAQAVGPNGRVIAFEPTAYGYEKLKANVALNPNVSVRMELFQTLLTEQDDDTLPASLYASWPLREEAGLHSGHLGRLQTTAGATVESLDRVLARLNVSAISLVKLDVDGYECKVLKGAGSLFSKFRPIFLMELSPYVLAEHGGSLKELVNIFRSAGYEFRDLDDRTPLPMDESSLDRMIPAGAGRNVIARPRAESAKR